MFLKWLSRRAPGAAPGSDPLQQARAARTRGDYDAARDACMEVLRESPQGQADAMALLGAIAADQGQLENGLEWVRRALAADRNCVAAHFARGLLLEGAERIPEAEASYRQVTMLDPTHAKAHTNLGCMLHLQERLPEAVACYRRALALEPGQPEALRNYALIAGSVEQLGEAVAGFESHLARQPGDAWAHYQLAHLHLRLGQPERALGGYDRAIALQPEQADFHFARAQVLLLLGRYPEGWREYEWRWRMDRFNGPMRRFSQPRWDGRPLENGTLLVHGETGLGDTLQFVRYAALAAARGVRVVVECQPALTTLVAGVEGVAQAVSQGEPLPPFDAHLPLIAFPGLFETTIDTIPWRGPYVRPDPLREREWAALVAGSRPLRRKVGIVWTGNPQNRGNRERSVTLQQLAPLTQAGEITFFSLQKGVAAQERGPVPEGMHFVDLTPQIRDFVDTAALMAQLDGVVAVDTSVLHLAGAMGRRTWALVPYSPDWRYHAGRRDNPWYPTMQLFRQETDGDWSAPLEALRKDLAAWAGQ
ncbi:tetratricopeptide repeat protein [Ramlibacter pallidus]|uniref:Tetratricopeptide repeat protein n=1 Tax=Ramlibacter pallidus TaxID=2780087 RepID=A0ABR9S1M6_9BURK|nr:tetratricopeptide repeat protein [Ramlibacter pallidus]MBE7367422.1 tetratricopeptide repeat protein [Ramlibacter pallidus]